MDKGFPKRVDETFSGMTGKVTAGFVLRGKCKFIQSFKWFGFKDIFHDTEN